MGDAGETGREGMLVAFTAIKDPRVTEEMLINWYNEHGPDVVQCKELDGCMYHYLNADASIPANNDMSQNFQRRMTSPETSIDDIAEAEWPSLAMIKIANMNWVLSQEFADIPRDSKQFPQNDDGSMGNAFVLLYPGLRTYETVGRQTVTRANGSNQPTDMLMVQLTDADSATFDELESTIRSNISSLHDSIRLKLMDGLLPYQEAGKLPQGMALFRYSGGATAPKSLLNGLKNVVRADVWKYRRGWNDGDHNL